MTRKYHQNGETMAYIRGGFLPAGLHELGLSADGFDVLPRFFHQDVNADDFGPFAPADVLSMMSEIEVRMTLIHWDLGVLNACMACSAGLVSHLGRFGPTQAGQPMGSMRTPTDEFDGADVSRFVRLSLMNMDLSKPPWRFHASYLLGDPLVIPIGVKASAVQLRWRVVPYVVPTKAQSFEPRSRNAILYDHFWDFNTQNPEGSDPDGLLTGEPEVPGGAIGGFIPFLGLNPFIA